MLTLAYSTYSFQQSCPGVIHFPELQKEKKIIRDKIFKKILFQTSKTSLPSVLFLCRNAHQNYLKKIMITLYERQQKRHRCIEQSSGGRGRGWDDMGEWHWNMYIIICETNRQSRFDAWYRVLRADALGWPRGIGWGGRWEGVLDGEHMNTHGRFKSVYAKPIQYCKVK